MMFKRIIIPAAIVALLLAGCTSIVNVVENAGEQQGSSRIECVSLTRDSGPTIYIYKDLETGYEYMFINCGYCGGVVRLDSKPDGRQ